MIGIERRELNYPTGVEIAQAIKDYAVVDMRFADYLIRGSSVSVGLERVTNSGLLSDIETGRMIEKLEGCSREFDIVILIGEGLILPSKNGKCAIGVRNAFKYFPVNSNFKQGIEFSCEMRETNFNYNRFAEFLTSVSLRWIDKIEWTLSPRHTAERIISLHNYFSKTKHELHMVKPRLLSNLTREKKVAEMMLSEIPGVGLDRAHSLVAHFGNVHSVVNATVKELCRVEGIGRVTASRIYDECRQRHA